MAGDLPDPPLDGTHGTDRAVGSGSADGDDLHHRLVALVTGTADAGPAALGKLWDELRGTYGHEVASRAWQEGLSSSDASQT
jgi:hypothetical protein